MFDSTDVYEKVMSSGSNDAMIIEYVANDVDNKEFRTLVELISLATYHESCLRSIRNSYINTKYRLE